MNAYEAANHYHYLDVKGVPGEAASFAREYEDGCSAKDFALFNLVLERDYGL